MIDSVVVVIPAKDEQDEICGCLRSVVRASDALRESTQGRISARIVVVLDDCRDTTAELVAGFPDAESITCRNGAVGAARRVGAEHALATGAPASLLLAGTDADCRVPANWLVRMIAHADSGADLVLGTVRPSGDLPGPLMRMWLAAHDLGDGHPHVHGANLGIRASSYLELGGWSPLAAHEDRDLVNRAELAAHVAIRRCGDVIVTTSSRRTGRTPHGFAGYLRALEESSGEAG